MRHAVFISDLAVSAMRAHLAAAYPLEGCGILIGRTSAGVSEILRAEGTRNADLRRGRDRYEIPPLEYLAVERELDTRAAGLRIVGFFHSHPDAPAVPSRTDLEMAQGLFDVTRERLLYAIGSVTNGCVAEPALWQLSEDASRFLELQWSGWRDGACV